MKSKRRFIIPPRCGNGRVYGLLAVIIIVLAGILLLCWRPYILVVIVIIAGLVAGYVVLQKPSTGYYRDLVLLLDPDLMRSGILTGMDPEEFREFIETDLRRAFAHTVITSRWQPLTAEYSRERDQYDVGIILNDMLATMPDQARVRITYKDLFQEPFHHAMGYGTKNAAVISLRRIDPVYLAEGSGDTEDLRVFRDRAVKLVIHEVGHLYGLTHCLTARCVMRRIEYEEEYFDLNADFCSECCRRLPFQ